MGGGRGPAGPGGPGGAGAAGGSWHAQYAGSAYVFVGGLDRSLTEGDVLAVMAQCGEVADLNLPRCRETGRPRGFGFLAYADQRSTVLAVDNLHGARVAGRALRVEHVLDYRRKAREMGLPEPQPLDPPPPREEGRGGGLPGARAAAPPGPAPPGGGGRQPVGGQRGRVRGDAGRRGGR